jgi:small subunit ribosomal protein S35
MATALQGFRLTARGCTCREVAHRYSAKPVGRRRTLSTTPLRWKNKQSDTFSKARSVLGEDPQEAFDHSQLVTPGEWNEIVKTEAQGSMERFKSRFPPPTVPIRRKKLKQTFMNLGDPEPWEEEGQIEDDHDDLPTLGHGELEQHREMRHYARLAAWEMPLLASRFLSEIFMSKALYLGGCWLLISDLAKPFQPPSADMPLRFRYTTYMGEQHPAEKKVVLEFSPADMPNLTTLQREKLKKLVGVRYNPEKDIVKMSCEIFETQAQNKRYLGDLVDNLLQEARVCFRHLSMHFEMIWQY